MSRTAFWTFAVLSLLIAVLSLRWLLAPLALVMPGMAHFVDEAPWRLWGHILGGPLALMLAPVQVSQRIRMRWPVLHRWSGRLYGGAVLVAGLAGMTLAPTSIASDFARAGFVVLGAVWIACTSMGIACAMRGQLGLHRWWMQRSLALAFSAVTLRFMMAPLMASGWTVSETYDITAWGSWLFNLAMLQAWILWRGKRNAAAAAAL